MHDQQPEMILTAKTPSQVPQQLCATGSEHSKEVQSSFKFVNQITTYGKEKSMPW